MSNITVVPIKEEYTVVVEEDDKIAVVTNSVIVNQVADLTNYYTKPEVNTLLTTKADVVHTHVIADITDFTSAFINGGGF